MTRRIGILTAGIGLLFLTSQASAIEFEGGILGKLFNGNGCACKASPAAPTCEPAPEPSPAPEPEAEPASLTCCPCPVAAAEPAPEPVVIEAAPCECPVVEAEPEPEPEPVVMESTPCCTPVYIYCEPAAVESASVEAAPVEAAPVETIISEVIISEGFIVDPPKPESAPAEVDQSNSLFGPAAVIQKPRMRLVFTPKHGWSKPARTKPVRTSTAIANNTIKPQSTARTLVLKKRSGDAKYRLIFTKTNAPTK